MKNLINRVLPLIFAAIMLATPAVAESDWKSNLLDEFVSLIMLPLEKLLPDVFPWENHRPRLGRRPP